MNTSKRQPVHLEAYQAPSAPLQAGRGCQWRLSILFKATSGVCVICVIFAAFNYWERGTGTIAAPAALSLLAIVMARCEFKVPRITAAIVGVIVSTVGSALLFAFACWTAEHVYVFFPPPQEGTRPLFVGWTNVFVCGIAGLMYGFVVGGSVATLYALYGLARWVVWLIAKNCNIDPDKRDSDTR